MKRILRCHELEVFQQSRAVKEASNSTQYQGLQTLSRYRNVNVFQFNLRGGRDPS